MASGKFVSYLRVSTAKQGATGLGIEAQRAAVAQFLNGGRWQLITEVVEVESGKRDDRPKLAEALKLCRIHNATLVIARLDRLSRDASFLIGLQKSGVRFVAADMPEANEMVVGIMAVIAQAERKKISTNTRAALAEAKKRGVKMGGFRGHVPTAEQRHDALAARQGHATARASDLLPTVRQLQAQGVTSLNGLARALSEKGIETARGSSKWSAVQVQRLLASMPQTEG